MDENLKQKIRKTLGILNPEQEITLGEMYDEYLASGFFKGLARKSKVNYRSSLRNLLRHFGRRATIDHVLDNQKQFIRSLEKQNISGQTVRYHLVAVRVFLNFYEISIKHDYRVPRKDIQEQKNLHMRRWFSEYEITKCLNYKFLWDAEMAFLFRIMIRVFIETGARLSEVEGVKWEDVDIDNGIMTITTTKTVPRPAFFSPKTSDMIRELRSRFITPPAGKIFPGKTIMTAAIKQMLYDLGLKEEGDYRAAHTFRHWCASYMFYSGEMAIEDIAFILGDVVDTIRVKYLHPTPLMLRNRVAKAMKWGRYTRPDPIEEVNTIKAEAIEALKKLGYTQGEAKGLIRKAGTESDSPEEMVKSALAQR